MSCSGQVDGDSCVGEPKDTDFQIPKRTPGEQTYLGGHGGNVEPGYEAEGGWGRDEAVTLLRQFYVQENGRGMSTPPPYGPLMGVRTRQFGLPVFSYAPKIILIYTCFVRTACLGP